MVASSVARVVEVNARNYRRTYRGTMITTFLEPVLFLAGMGVGLGTLVNSSGSSSLGGLPYVDFIAPGLLAATAMQVAAGEGTWPVMAAIKWIKTYHAVLATPVGTGDLVTGNLLWVGIRLVFGGIVFVTIAIAFGAIPAAGGYAAVAPAVLTGLAFAAPIMAFTTVAPNDTWLSALYRFGVIPMFLFSGTFFPVTQLPGWMQPVAYATPLWHGVELTRSLALGMHESWPPALHVAYLAAWTVTGWALAIRGLERRMKP